MTRLFRLTIDKPEETGCYGFVLRIGRFALSVAYRRRAADEYDA
jgi:hypothetical protein